MKTCQTRIFLKLLVDWLVTTYRSGQKLSGILYLHRISDTSHERIFPAQSSHVPAAGRRRLLQKRDFSNILLVTRPFSCRAGTGERAQNKQQLLEADDLKRITTGTHPR